MWPGTVDPIKHLVDPNLVLRIGVASTGDGTSNHNHIYGLPYSMHPDVSSACLIRDKSNHAYWHMVLQLRDVEQP